MAQDHERRRQQIHLQILSNSTNHDGHLQGLRLRGREREADVSIRRENLLLRLRLRYAMNDENRYDLHLTKNKDQAFVSD